MNIFHQILGCLLIIFFDFQSQRSLFSAIDQIKQQLRKMMKPLQPLACVVDPSRKPKCIQDATSNSTPAELHDTAEYFVMVDDRKIEVASPIDALQWLFKFCMSAHALYPLQSVMVWTMWQKILYEISTPWDVENPTTKKIMKSLTTAMQNIDKD